MVTRSVSWGVLWAMLLAGCGGGGGGSPGVAPPEPVVFIGAGDIADCDGRPASESAAAGTAAIIAANPAAAVFALGDNAYDNGTIDEYRNCYAPTWGSFRDRTHPAPGNHDYDTSGADGYFTYYGARAGTDRRGYYSFDLGAWHVVSLNSNVDASRGSAQEQWLRADLAASRKRCTLAYWHHPVFSSSSVHGNDPKMAEIWQALQEFGADVVLTGHDHGYERFAPQTSSGVADPVRGIRQFVIGTGGAPHYAFGATKPNSEVRIGNTFGVVRFTLRDGSYDWEFIPSTVGGARDAGQASCSE